jgi:hypothetical protein
MPMTGMCTSGGGCPAEENILIDNGGFGGGKMHKIERCNFAILDVVPIEKMYI